MTWCGWMVGTHARLLMTWHAHAWGECSAQCTTAQDSSASCDWLVHAQDDLYLQQTAEACHDLVRRMAGAYPALQYARETQLAAELLYYGLTTGVGLQTLGEEYCSLLQVTGQGSAPTLSRRAALVGLRALGPYLANSLAARLSAHQHATSDEASEPSASAWGPAADDCLSSSGAGEPSTSSGPFTSLISTLRTGWSRVLHYTARLWPKLQPATAGAARAHLALFYVFGVYYLLSHRLAGIRYISTTKPLQGWVRNCAHGSSMRCAY